MTQQHTRDTSLGEGGPFGGRMIGRQQELARLVQLAGTSRFVMVVGPPGVGKSRLVREGARRLSARGRCVWLCDLTGCQTAQELCERVSAHFEVPVAFGHDVQTSSAQVDAWGHVIDEHGPVTIILDNADSLTAAAHAAVERWLDRAMRASVLMTAQGLGHAVRGERIVLAPLSLPAEELSIEASEAGQMWLAEARQVRDDYQLGDEEREAVVALLRTLGGLPLAIEAAARRLSLTTTKDLLERCRSRAAGAPRTVAEMGATMDAAWDRLCPAERMALAQCAALDGGISLAMAEQVLDLGSAEAPNSVFDVLCSLESRSLLWSRVGTSARLCMLEPVRTYVLSRAAEELAPTEGVVQRWGAQLAALVRRTVRWTSAPEAVPPPALTEEGRTLRSLLVRLCTDMVLDVAQAADVAIGVALLTFHDGSLPGCLAFIDRTLEHQDLDDMRRAELLLLRGCMELREGRAGSALGSLEASLELSRVCADRALESLAARRVARAKSLEGRHGEARLDLEAALSVARQCPEPSVEAECLAEDVLALTGLSRATSGEPEHAHADEAHSLYAGLQRLGDPHATALGDLALGRLALGMADHAEVGRRLERLRRVSPRVGGHWLVAEERMLTSLLHVEEGRLGRAAEALSDAARYRARAGRCSPGEEEGLAALVGLELGDPGATARLRRLVGLFDGQEAPRELAYVAAWLACVESEAGSGQRAADALRRAECLSVDGDAELEACLSIARVQVEGHGSEARVGSMERALDSARSAMASSERVRWLARWARRVDDAAEAEGGAFEGWRRRTPDLVIEASGAWFQVSGGERVALGNKGVQRALLRALARAAARRHPVTVAELASGLWPEMDPRSPSVANRIYVHMSGLRSLGLRTIIKRHPDGGYMLDPELSVRVFDAAREQAAA